MTGVFQLYGEPMQLYGEDLVLYSDTPVSPPGAGILLRRRRRMRR